MATKVVVCPACETPLVPGRYSCASCGALVAAVASDSRSFLRPEQTVPPVLEPATQPAERNGHHVADADDGDAQDGLEDYDDDSPLQSADVDGPDDADDVVWGEPDPAPVAASAVQPYAPQPPPAPPAPSWPEQPAWPPARGAVVAAEPAPRTPAGAYLPPSAVLPPGEALPVNGKNGAAQTTGPGATKPKQSLAERLTLGEDDGPLGLPVTTPGRAIAIGAALAGLGFILPWAEIVIGSGSIGSFLDQWGLAGPGHPLVLLLLIVVGGLAVANERLPVKVATRDGGDRPRGGSCSGSRSPTSWARIRRRSACMSPQQARSS